MSQIDLCGGMAVVNGVSRGIGDAMTKAGLASTTRCFDREYGSQSSRVD